MRPYVRRPPPAIEAVRIRDATPDELRALPGVRPVREGHVLLGEEVVPPDWWLYRYVGGDGTIHALPDPMFRDVYEEASS